MKKAAFLLACFASGGHGRRLQNSATKSHKLPIASDTIINHRLFAEVNRSDGQARVRGLATLLLRCHPDEIAFTSSVCSKCEPSRSHTHPVGRVLELPVMLAPDLEKIDEDSGADDRTMPEWVIEALREDALRGDEKGDMQRSKRTRHVQSDRFRVQGDLLINKHVCAGCGCGFHSESPDVPGYIPADVFARIGSKKDDMSLEVLDLAALEMGEDDVEDENVDLEELDLAELDAPEEVHELQDANKEEELSSMTVADLKVKLKALGEKLNGNKADLIARLQDRMLLDSAKLDGAEVLNDAELDLTEDERKEWAEAIKQKEKELPTFCQRCFRLRQYGELDDEMRPGWSRDETLMPAHFQKIINTIGGKKCVVLTLVDVFDFHGSILPNIKELAGDNPVIVAVNKADLLPENFNEGNVRSWIRHECASYAGLKDLPGVAIHLVSAKTGRGVDKLMDTAKQLAKERKCDIYVVGAANVGKSSLLNRICDAEGGQSNRGSNSKKHSKKAGITISPVPGTTLSFLKVGIGNGVKLFDTPGLILPHQLTVQLNSEELRQVVPEKRVHHKTLRMGEGKAVLLGGLARIEIEHGKPFFCTVFVADGVKIQPTDAARHDLDEFVRTHVGDLLTPPMEPERLLDIGELETHRFTIEGVGWTDAACDIVLSGLGWVSFTGSGMLTFKVSVPKGVMVIKREPLIPSFSIKSTSMKYTGGRLVGGFSRKKKVYTPKAKKSTFEPSRGGRGNFGKKKSLERKFGAKRKPSYR